MLGQDAGHERLERIARHVIGRAVGTFDAPDNLDEQRRPIGGRQLQLQNLLVPVRSTRVCQMIRTARGAFLRQRATTYGVSARRDRFAWRRSG
ncbi:MAG TPA: hypothetical protein VLH79_11450 [Chthonomonadales bacterium]|nr:hypothetical protein [Chthonomonadales bacterium]